MPGVRDHLDQQEPGHAPARREPASPEAAARPAITGAGDPRLAHASKGTQADLMHVQRTAGNAAVSSLMTPAVQRAVEIDEITSTVEQAPQAADAGQTQATGGGTGGGTGEADHTITAGHIGLDAPMVEASGVLRAQTVIADSIVAANYTPGAGNIW